MAGEQKMFLQLAAQSWRAEFPFLRPVNLDEVPRVPKGCNYLCDEYGSTRGRFYFISFDFSQKCRGEFSIGITISTSPARSTLDASLANEPTPFTVGSFGIWQFLKTRWFAWALVDLEAEERSFLRELKVEGAIVELPPRRNLWRPASYDQPFENIAAEALSDVNHKLRQYVFPVLEIDIDKHTSHVP